jgi:hypothetical protein
VTKSTYLNSIHNLGLDKLILSFLNLSTSLTDKSERFLETEQANNQKELNQLKALVKSVTDDLIQAHLGKLVTESFGSESFKVENVNQILEYFSSSLEVVSTLALIFAASTTANKSFKTIWSEKTKKSKKKKTNYLQYAQSVDLVYEIYEMLCQLVNYLHLQLKSIICPTIVAKCECVYSVTSATLSSNLTSNSQLNDMAQSYHKSFEELRTHFGNKLKYLLRLSSNMAASSLVASLENLKLN